LYEVCFIETNLRPSADFATMHLSTIGLLLLAWASAVRGACPCGDSPGVDCGAEDQTVASLAEWWEENCPDEQSCCDACPSEGNEGGLNCNDEGRVIDIFLGDRNLASPVPWETITGYDQLEVIILSSNQLTDELPDFSGLTELDGLFLDDNQFTGQVPDLSGLPKLMSLHLRANDFDCPVPYYNDWVKDGPPPAFRDGKTDWYYSSESGSTSYGEDGNENCGGLSQLEEDPEVAEAPGSEAMEIPVVYENNSGSSASSPLLVFLSIPVLVW